jgi:hypothetical protein
MTFNGPPKQEKKATAPEAVQIPEYWQENIPFKSPKKYFELQFAFAKIMAERTGSSLTEAVEKYAPIIRNSTHHLEENRDVGAPIEGVTDENMLDVAWNTSVERHLATNSERTEYHPEGSTRFGCYTYDYKNPPTVRIHFFNAEFEEEWVDGKDVSKGPLDKSKIERRKQELKDMFTHIKREHPEAKYVRGRSNLYNLESYRRLYPDSYTVGDIDYSEKLWRQGTSIWGQFLGGNEKVAGEYGFKEELAGEFLEKAKTVPLDRLADALPMPPKTAEGPIEDFYTLYGIA